MKKQVVFWFFIVLAQMAVAYVPGGLNFQGRIIKPTGEPLEASTVVFTLKVMDPTVNDCLLYEETQTLNMSNSDGVFNLIVGQGSRTSNDPGKSVSAVFSNSSTPLTGLTCLGGVTAYTPSAGDIRKIRAVFNDGTQTVTLGSDFEVRSVPYAMYAESLQGKTPGNFVQTSANITQSNVESIFSHFSDLMDIVSGSSNLYMRSGSGAQALSGTYTFSGGVSAPEPTTGSNVATKSYADSKIAGRDADLTGLADGMVIKWNGAQSKFIVATVSAGGGGTVTGVTAASPLVSSGGSAPEISLESGTATSQVLYWTGATWTKQYLNASDLKNASGQMQIPSCMNSQTMTWNSGSDKYECVDIAIAGSKITSDLIVNAAGFTGSLAGDISGTQGSTSLDKIKGKPLATSLNSLAGADSGKVLQWDGSKWDAGTIVSGVSSLPSASSVGQILRWNGSSWVVSFLNMGDLRSAGALTQMPACTESQTITYAAGTDTYICTDIAIAGTRVTGNISGNAAGFTGVLAGDVTGSQGLTVVEKLRGKTLSTTLGSLNNTTDVSKVLEWNGTNWVAASGTNQINSHYKTGSANQVLVSNGAGSNPSWIATSSIGGAVSKITSGLNADYSLDVANDKNKFIVFNSSVDRTLTLASAATAGAAYVFAIRNQGSGTVTIQPAASQYVNSLSSFILAPSSSLILISDGSANWYSLQTAHSATTPPSFSNVQAYTSSGTFAPPAGTYTVRITLVGGGGGGSGGGAGGSSSCWYDDSNGGGGGSGGAGGGSGAFAQCVIGVQPLASYSVNVGQGGAGGLTSGSAGAASSFGTFVSVGGGAGGNGQGGNGASASGNSPGDGGSAVTTGGAGGSSFAGSQIGNCIIQMPGASGAAGSAGQSGTANSSGAGGRGGGGASAASLVGGSKSGNIGGTGGAGATNPAPYPVIGAGGTSPTISGKSEQQYTQNPGQAASGSSGNLYGAGGSGATGASGGIGINNSGSSCGGSPTSGGSAGPGGTGASGFVIVEW